MNMNCAVIFITVSVVQSAAPQVRLVLGRLGSLRWFRSKKGSGAQRLPKHSPNVTHHVWRKEGRLQFFNQSRLSSQLGVRKC